MFKRINITQKLTRAGGLVAGAAATQMLNNRLVPMVLKNADVKTTNLVTFGIGLFGPDLMKKRTGKPGLLDAVADGIVATSGLNLVGNFIPGISGIGGDYFMEEGIHGYLDRTFHESIHGPYSYEQDLSVVQ